MELSKLNSFSFYIWLRQFSILTFSSSFYLATGLFFLKINKESLMMANLYESSFNFLLATASFQLFMSFLSCVYLYKRYVQRIERPINQMESFLNDLTKKENPDHKLNIDRTFSNIKRVSLLMKVLISFWRIENIKQNKKIEKLSKQKTTTKNSTKTKQKKAA